MCACECLACVKERESVLCVRETKEGGRECKSDREREGRERTKGSKFNSER